MGLLLLGGAAQAYEIDALQVGHDGKEYRVQVEARLAAPQARVFATLADFAALPEINPSVTRVQVGEPDEEGRWPVTSEAEFCVLGVCRSLRHMQRLRLLPDGGEGGVIEAETVPPPASDFRAGFARWQVLADGDGSRLRFEAGLELDFWLPPVVGSWAVQRRLRDDVTVTIQRLEQRSRAVVP